ncbi:hypothetical protein Leryth_004242 [Lithospermum erythrorhizon]|nr:hypothetical protein Leryth_004242 [Lithospermum erythrorhizon]
MIMDDFYLYKFPFIYLLLWYLQLEPVDNCIWISFLLLFFTSTYRATFSAARELIVANLVLLFNSSMCPVIIILLQAVVLFMSSENWKGRSSITNMLYSGKTSLLPPKSPFQSIPPSYVDYVPNPSVGKKSVGNPREGNTHHQRTSSEGFLLEEQPSWLDELLNEPDTPVRKGGHHRSSSDSFAYIDTPDVNLDYLAKDENNKSRNMVSPSWQLPDLGHYRDIRHGSYYTDTKSSGKNQTRSWDRSSNAAAYPHSLPSPREKSLLQSSKSSAKPQGAEAIPSTASEKREAVIFSREPNGFSERRQPSSAKPSVSETDTKRANQQFAQRSRVRKLQYIAELERNVQTLQASKNTT